MKPDTAAVSIPDDSAACAKKGNGPGRRRKHHKSRTGCRPCKKGRIKCDEERPVCRNCIKKDLVCDYFDTRYGGERPQVNVNILPKCHSEIDSHAFMPRALCRGDSRSIPGGHLTSTNLFSKRPKAPGGHLLELELFHHYLEMTQRATEFQLSWSCWMIEQASASQSVMDALLGISAFHLRRHKKHDQSLREASYKYMARAIGCHKQELSTGINKQNAASVTAACALICVHAISNSDCLADADGQQMPHQWFIPFQRAMKLVKLALPFMKDAAVDLAFMGPNFEKEIGFVPSRAAPFDFLLYYPFGPGFIDRENGHVYRSAVALLTHLYSDLPNQKPLQFPVIISPAFVDLLASKDSRALAIVGYYFMLVKKGRPFWWVDGMPESEFAGVMALLPRDWWPVMDWAIQEFGFCEKYKNTIS